MASISISPIGDGNLRVVIEGHVDVIAALRAAATDYLEDAKTYDPEYEPTYYVYAFLEMIEEAILTFTQDTPHVTPRK